MKSKWLLAVCLLAVGWWSMGCGSVLNQGDMQALTSLLREVAANGSAAIDDPSVKVYWVVKTGVEVQLDGINAQGSGRLEGEGPPVYGPTTVPAPEPE